ncbi:MAG: hypothetical protein DMG58_25330 [Acidobacteria bacterium]|nr:MAG: hypothetical protein DMG58_25330 [Acidobacteriota bacterium]
MAGLVPIIIGFGVNGWNVYRALRREGIRPLVIDNDPDSIFWKCAGAAKFTYSRELSGPMIVDCLNSLADEGGDYVLISALEDTVSTLNEHRNALRPNVRLLFPCRDTVRMLLDKKAFYKTATSLNCTISPMYFLEQDDWLAVSWENETSFPCIVKTRTKMYVRGLAKAYLVANKAELVETFKTISLLEGVRPRDIVIQEWVPGPDDRVIFCMQYYCQSKPLISFVGRKIRQWRPQVGGTASATAIDDPEALTEATRFFQSVRMEGICSMEFKRSSKNGRLYMIEPTACRADYQEGVAVANGYNIPFAAYAAAVGQLSYQPAPTPNPLKWVYLGSDYMAAAQYVSEGKLSWSDWLKSLRGPKAFAIFAWEDPRPFLELVRRKVIGRLIPWSGGSSKAS